VWHFVENTVNARAQVLFRFWLPGPPGPCDSPWVTLHVDQLALSQCRNLTPLQHRLASRSVIAHLQFPTFFTPLRPPEKWTFCPNDTQGCQLQSLLPSMCNRYWTCQRLYLYSFFSPQSMVVSFHAPTLTFPFPSKAVLLVFAPAHIIRGSKRARFLPAASKRRPRPQKSLLARELLSPPEDNVPARFVVFAKLPFFLPSIRDRHFFSPNPAHSLTLPF